MRSNETASANSWRRRLLAHLPKVNSAAEYPSNIPYKPIVPSVGYIRLVRVEPGERDEQIKCSFIQKALNDPDPEAIVYEALSYSWGNRTRVHKILMDGVETGVPANVHAALLRFRNEHDKNSGVIWIDFLSINQDDVEEKNIQVAQMRQIYEQAHRVIVWLGPDSEDGNVAYDFLYEATQYWQEEDEEEWLMDAVRAPHREEQWRSLSSFLEREYWSRIWIVQEAVCGRIVDVWWGEKHVLSWQEFRALPYQMYIYQATISQQPEYWVRQLSVLEEKFTATSLEGLRQSVEEGHTYWTLYPLMMTNRIKAATDSRDKVYALLGLAEKFRQGGSLFKPDYRLSKLEVYIQAFVYAVAVGNQPHPGGVLESPLNILCAGEYLEDKDENWPTWVPRWDQKLSFGAMQFRVVTHPFAASGKHQGGMHLDVDGRSLRLSGVSVDKLEQIAGPLPVLQYRKKPSLLKTYGFRDSQKAKAGYDVVCSWWKMASQHGWSDDTILQMAKTLSCDRDNAEELWDDDELLSMARPWTKWVNGREVLNAMDDELFQGMSLCIAMFNHSKNRRFCITREGRFVLGPPLARKEDYICVLVGCDFPVVLRRVNDYFVFIGDCYAHGIMHGEVMDMARIGRSKLQTLELR